MTELVALSISIAVEALVAAGLLRALRWGPGWRGALAATVGTLGTHPLAWWSMLALLEEGWDYGTGLALVEAGVVLAESLAYRVLVPLRWRWSLLASLLANGASTGLGLALAGLGAK